MAISFKYGGATFTVETAQEAADTLSLLKQREMEVQERREKRERHEQYEAFMQRKMSQGAEYLKEAQELISSYDESKFVWTADRFRAFIDRLGKPQKLALGLLVTKRSVTDEDLRKALDVSGNQALAGVLSGISKQAIALFIPPRAIFNFENFRAGGKRRSEYLVQDEFRKIAADLNWPRAGLSPDPKSIEIVTLD